MATQGLTRRERKYLVSIATKAEKANRVIEYSQMHEKSETIRRGQQTHMHRAV